jgi:hypothetical protein
VVLLLNLYAAPQDVVFTLSLGPGQSTLNRTGERIFTQHLGYEFPRRPLLGNSVNKDQGTRGSISVRWEKAIRWLDAIAARFL